jgi:hypothetical protein
MYDLDVWMHKSTKQDSYERYRWGEALQPPALVRLILRGVYAPDSSEM